VTTTGGAYPVYGTDPASMVKGDMIYDQANLSKRSLVTTPQGVIYAAPDGLAMISGAGGRLLTGSTYTKSQWSALTASNLIGFYYDGKYYGFFSGTGTGIVVPLGDQPTIIQYDISGITFYGGYVDPEDDILYLLIKDGSGDYYVRSWEQAATYINYTWLSPIKEFPVDINMACGRVEGDFTNGKTVTFTLYADGVLKKTKVLTSNAIFRCPGGFRAPNWQMGLSGDAPAVSAAIATSPGELTTNG
jgi:hypothetical protein